MVNTIPLSNPDNSSLSAKLEGKNPFRLIEKNYRNNLRSDYTEKIEELDKDFNYTPHSTSYWSEPEFSTLYGPPFYEQASSSQRIALNHLAWVSQYNHIANSEVETVHYNRITAGSLAVMGGAYNAIADQLEHEAVQERSHIHAFYKVSYRTMKALLGKQAFINSSQEKSRQPLWERLQISDYQYNALHFSGKLMLSGKEEYYSHYLKELEENNKLSTSTNGFFHGRGQIPEPLLRFFAFNWGSSPFLACQYYVLRFMANMVLKHKEHGIFLYCKKLQKQSEGVPAPTAISYYHLLDEAFHTTTSLFLARDLYKQLPKPTAYEKFVVNLTVYMAQRSNLQGLSGALTSLGDDRSLMPYIYRLFQSLLFGMSGQEALEWMKKCFCQEHEGFHLSAKFHQRILSDLRRSFEGMDYLWPINREMQVMAAGGSIAAAIQTNTKAFQHFSKSIT